MKDNLFNTEKKRQAAIVTFQTGMSNPFWQLMTQILEANIEVITKQILDGGAETTKEQMDRLRDKLKVHKEVINTPKSMIEKLASSPEGKEVGLDPYLTVKELKKERGRVSD